MADRKLDPDELREKLEPVGGIVAKAGKTLAKKAEPAVKAVGERTAEAGKAAGDIAAGAGKRAGETLRAGREAVSAGKPLVFVQYGGREFRCDELLERAKADFRAHNKGAVRACRLYIKPEENAAYYVISGKEGKIAL